MIPFVFIQRKLKFMSGIINNTGPMGYFQVSVFLGVCDLVALSNRG